MENFGTRLSVEDIWRVVLFLRTIHNGTLTDSELCANSRRLGAVGGQAGGVRLLRQPPH